MELDDEGKELVQQLGSAINAAVSGAPEVADALDSLRRAGYELELTVRLEIALRRREPDEPESEVEARLELTDEDRRTLRSMRIRFDESD